MRAAKRYPVRIKGPFGPFDGLAEDDLAEGLMREMYEVREEEWELSDEQAACFVHEDGYAYAMTVFEGGKPQLVLTQKEVWDDPDSFASIAQDPTLLPEQKTEEIRRLIMERRRAQSSTPTAPRQPGASDSEVTERLASSICLATLHALFDDELWRAMGFRRRPRRGRLFRRLVKADRLALEDFCRRELVILAFSQMAKAVKRRHSPEVSTPVLSRALELIVDGPFANAPFWDAFAFRTRDEAVDYLIEGIQSYLPLPNDRMPDTLLSRAEPLLPTEKSHTEFMVGCPLMFRILDLLPFTTERLLDAHPLGLASHLRTADARIAQLVRDLPSPPSAG